MKRHVQEYNVYDNEDYKFETFVWKENAAFLDWVKLLQYLTALDVIFICVFYYVRRLFKLDFQWWRRLGSLRVASQTAEIGSLIGAFKSKYVSKKYESISQSPKKKKKKKKNKRKHLNDDINEDNNENSNANNNSDNDDAPRCGPGALISSKTFCDFMEMKGCVPICSSRVIHERSAKRTIKIITHLMYLGLVCAVNDVVDAATKPLKKEKKVLEDRCKNHESKRAEKRLEQVQDELAKYNRKRLNRITTEKIQLLIECKSTASIVGVNVKDAELDCLGSLMKIIYGNSTVKKSDHDFFQQILQYNKTQYSADLSGPNNDTQPKDHQYFFDAFSERNRPQMYASKDLALRLLKTGVFSLKDTYIKHFVDSSEENDSNENNNNNNNNNSKNNDPSNNDNTILNDKNTVLNDDNNMFNNENNIVNDVNDDIACIDVDVNTGGDIDGNSNTNTATTTNNSTNNNNSTNDRKRKAS